MKKNVREAGVSIYVLTYEQSWKKLKMTLDSVICQKGIDFEIIISDDGSEENHHEDVSKYFQDRLFTDYTFIGSEQNTGIVQNAIRASLACRKSHVKIISPGDCLLEEDTLCRWFEFLRESGKRWSFSDVVPYKNDGGVICKVSAEEHPRLKEEYRKGDDEISRWNYVGLNDIAVGVAMMTESELFCEYLSKIDGRVVYAEDNIYRLMMYDGVVGIYYPQSTILYEYGCGISTRADREWDRKISKDWNETNKIMFETYNSGDMLQRKVLSGKKPPV